MPYFVPKKALLLVHLIVPVLLAVAILDQYVFDSVLKPHLQLTATAFLFYLLFFDLPHIVGSFVSYADKEYITQYKKQLLAVPFVVLAVYFLYMYDFTLLFILYGLYTMWHVMRQQAGITRMFLGPAGILHEVWIFSAIVMYSSGFFLVFKRAGSSVPPSDTLFVIMQAAFAVFVLLSFLYFLKVRGRQRQGLIFLGCTMAIVASGFYFLQVGYVFLTLFVLRFVHDVTAFFFYAVHDSNRNYETAPNYFYKFFKLFPVPLVVITPLFAIVVVLAFRHFGHVIFHIDLIIIALGIVHYYLEGFMWKRDSPHRRYGVVA
jgi:hypothetical protein